MGTESRDKDAQGANDQNTSDSKQNPGQSRPNPTSWQGDKSGKQDNEQDVNPARNQSIGQAWDTDSPTDQQPSGSQNNEWQQNHEQSAIPNGDQPGSDQYENNSRPSREFNASEDDEIGEEIPADYRTDEFIEENDLEKTDQDYRDGDNQSSENQDDEDALRNGK